VIRRLSLAALLLLGLSSTAGAVPLTITVAAGSDLPALGPCFADCHWEQVINPKVEPAVAQTAADWLEDLLHEPAWIDFALWCPPVTPPGLPTGPPQTIPPGTPRTPPGPPAPPPIDPPPTPPEPVGEAATGILLLVSTVGQVCERFWRRWVGTDLTYQHLSKKRTAQRGLRFVDDVEGVAG